MLLGTYGSQECEIELENISKDDNGNWTCILTNSLTNKSDQNVLNVKVLDFHSSLLSKTNEKGKGTDQRSWFLVCMWEHSHMSLLSPA